MTTFCGFIFGLILISFFLLGGMKMSGSAGAQRLAEQEMGNTQKNTATLTQN